MLQLEEVRRENKTLSNEIKDIMDQISEGGRSIHEIDKIRKRLEAEKLELQSALEEAEATLEQEENKVLRCQLELNAVRQEIERRLAEKEEEFLLVKKAQSKALDSMQVALETETKSKAEALRMRETLLTLVWLSSMPLPATPRPRPPSRSTLSRCVMPRPRLTMSPWPSLPLLTPRSPVTVGQLPCRTVWRRLVLFWRPLTASVVLRSRNWLTPTRPLPT